MTLKKGGTLINMTTQRQKNLAKAMVENLKAKKPKNKKELVVSSGYGITTAEKQVPAVFEQKGVIEELEKLGFSEENAKSVVGNILSDEDAKSRDRLTAADMTFKVHGTYAPVQQEIKQTTVAINFFSSPKIQQATKAYEEQLKQAIYDNETQKPIETLPNEQDLGYSE